MFLHYTEAARAKLVVALHLPLVSSFGFYRMFLQMFILVALLENYVPA